MKLKRILAISLSLTMLFSMSLSSVAEGALNKPVEVPNVNGETEVTIFGDVAVKLNEHAVLIRTEGLSETSDVSLTITKGNISLLNKNPTATTAIAAYADNGNTSIDINGKVTATSKSSGEEAIGIYTVAKKDHKSTVNVGDVNATSDGYSAIGIDAEADDSTVEISTKNVDVTSHESNAIGIDAEADDSTVEISTKNVDVTSHESDAIGINAYAENSIVNISAENINANSKKGDSSLGLLIDASNSSVDVNIKNDISVASSKKASEGSTGIFIANTGSDVNVEVGNDVNVKAKSNDGAGIKVLNNPEANSNVTIHGDLNVKGYGIVSSGNAGESQTNVVIEGTLDASKGAVLLTDILSEEPTSTLEPDLNLYVWKINTSRGTSPVAQRMIYNSDPMSSAEPEIKDDEDFTKNNIYYIIKIKQPNKGCTLSVTDENGSLATVNDGIIAAKEGTKLLIKSNLEEGYKISNVYGDESKNKLLVDENGCYYLIVTRGGGIYLTASCKKILSARLEEAQDACGFITNARMYEKVSIACFNSDTLDDSVIELLKSRPDLTVYIYCMINDIYGMIVIPPRTSAVSAKGDNGLVETDNDYSLSHLAEKYGFTALVD